MIDKTAKIKRVIRGDVESFKDFFTDGTDSRPMHRASSKLPATLIQTLHVQFQTQSSCLVSVLKSLDFTVHEYSDL
jgi:hypothetical protein